MSSVQSTLPRFNSRESAWRSSDSAARSSSGRRKPLSRKRWLTLRSSQTSEPQGPDASRRANPVMLAIMWKVTARRDIKRAQSSRARVPPCRSSTPISVSSGRAKKTRTRSTRGGRRACGAAARRRRHGRSCGRRARRRDRAEGVLEAFWHTPHPLFDPLGFLHMTLGPRARRSRAHRRGTCRSSSGRVPRARCVSCSSDSAWWAHIGDSRVYHLRGGASCSARATTATSSCCCGKG